MYKGHLIGLLALINQEGIVSRILTAGGCPGSISPMALDCILCIWLPSNILSADS